MSEEKDPAAPLAAAIQSAAQEYLAENGGSGFLTAFVFLGEYADVNGETGSLIAEGEQSAAHSLGLADSLKEVFATGVRSLFVPVFYGEEDE